jgi:hypothetical protein
MPFNISGVRIGPGARINGGVIPRGTLANPGLNGVDVYNSGQTTSGWYYIKTSTMATAKLVYCNMTDNGGGWMLVSYNPTQQSSNGMLYPNTWLNGQGTLDKFSVNVTDLWYHNSTAQCASVMKMASANANRSPFLALNEVANSVTYSDPGKLTLSTQAIPNAFATNQYFTGTWYPIQGQSSMTSPVSVNAPADWLYSFGSNFYWEVAGPSVAFPDAGNSGRNGSGLGTTSQTNSATNTHYGMLPSATYTTSSLWSLIDSYAFYIK